MAGKCTFRAFVTLAAFVVAWLVASPAVAFTSRAPVCDPRGAIMFAPPPQLQDVEQSFDIGIINEDCMTTPIENRHVVPHRGVASEEPSSAQDPTTMWASLCFPPGGSQRLLAPATVFSVIKNGFRSSIERPPRP
ncbi:MAG: hypothetical protein FWD69_11835 [Polyangiaceae bacterium]|nr:hypothetical protein [Polyangiaceae bacterium]